MWPMVPIKNLMDRVEQSTSNDEQVRWTGWSSPPAMMSR
jgi:hypothetical protein